MATTMLAVTAPTFTEPSGYEITQLPRPQVTNKTDVVIRVHAASVNPIDVKKASGAFKAAIKETFPYQIGYDAAGTVTEVGAGVTKFKAGDEVFVRLPDSSRGSFSEYVKSTEAFIALKPKSLSFAEAASLPLAAVTALQSLRKYRGSLEGKTVFVPGGLSGTGMFACQLAKNVFHAGKVITTVSTAKVPKVPELLGDGVVDEIIDYTKQNPADVIPAKSIDFFFDTTGQAMDFLSLMVPSTSMIVSISTSPSASTLENSGLFQDSPNAQLPLIGRLFLDASDAIRRLRARRWGVEYLYIFLEPNAKDLETIGGYADEGKLKTVVGTKVDGRNIEDVRKACGTTYTGKGGIGKTVLEFGQD